MWKIPSLYFQLTKNNRKCSVLFSHPLNPIQPQQKTKASHPPTPKFYQQKFTPENMLPKQENKPTFADLRLSILFGGWGGRALRSHFSGATFLACLLFNFRGVPLRVQVPRANMKHPPRRKTTTKVPSEPPERDDEAMPQLYMRNRVMGGPL